MPTLRPYAPKDYPHFLALDLETAADALGESTDQERALLRERWPRILAELQGFTPESFGAKDASLWVVEGEGGRYLGHLWLTEKRDPVHGGRLLEVTTMGIVRAARGEGLGRLLMHKAETEARERGIGDIELSVAGNNRRARDLYRDLGYETVRRTMRKRLRP
ncbi:MAG: GNAT family N-acetyltransferase [Myxococcales bacterium]